VPPGDISPGIATARSKLGEQRMYRHLLVTLDGSPRGEAVIPHAIDIARSMDAEITLLRVVDAISAEWSERGVLGRASSRSPLADHAEAYVGRVATAMRERGVKVHSLVRQGSPAQQIMAAVKDLDVDAIAMATHSRRGFNRLMFGSVAEQILHEASLPVILIRAA
jgi:nucleotide-binding universal stress UspA family protein